MKKTFKVSSKLKNLALWYNYTIVCKDIKRTIIKTEYDKKWDTQMCTWGFELTNPIEYTRQELLEKYDGNIKIERWAHTYTKDGQEAMAVVIE